MKKYLLTLIAATTLVACTSDVYSSKGNATIQSSKPITSEQVELVVQKDNGELVTITRNYDAHAAVGARVNIDDENKIKTIHRYEFK